MIVAGCGAASLVVGCSSHDDDAATITQAVGPDWIHPACSVDALQPPLTPTDACNGPWAYGWVETGTDAAACGEDTTKTCMQFNSCTSWDKDSPGDQLGVSEDNHQESSTGTFNCHPQCTFNIHDHCQTLASNRQTALHNAAVQSGAPTWALNMLSVSFDALSLPDSPPDPETGAVIHHYECDLHINNNPQKMTGARGGCGCAHFPPKTCTRDSANIVTVPGLGRPTIGAPTFPGDTRTWTASPACLTCDQMPVSTDADVQAKFQCLDDRLAAATGDLHLSLAARLELMFQQYGDRLTDAQRIRTKQIYDQNPGAATFCSIPLAWDPACKTAAGDGVPAELQLCSDLSNNDNVPRSVASLEFPHCLDALASTAQLQATTCRLSTREAAEAAAQGVMTRTYPELTGELTSILPAVLTRISAWWTAASTASAGDQTWLLGQANLLLGELHTNIEAGQKLLPNGAVPNDDAAETLLADVDGTRYITDFKLLSALFATGQTAPPLLLTLSGDALQPIADRLTRLEALHDVACRFAAGDPDLACRSISASDGSVALRSSATSELVHALSVLPDHDALRDVLAASTHLATQQPDMFAALSRMRDQHGYFDLAWTALGRTEPFSVLATIPDPPTQVVALATVVRNAGIAWASYAGSGLFIPWHKARLTTSALQQQQPALVGFIDGLIGQLSSERTSFETARKDTVNDLLTHIRQRDTTQNILDRMTVLRDQDADLIARSLAMESREATARASIAGYQTMFEALVSSNALDANAAYQPQTITPIFASAASAHYPGGSVPPDVTRDRIGPPLTMNPGESLRLKVSGTWAPTCTVMNAQIQGPDSDFHPIGAPDAETGPEGYWVSLANGSFKAHSTSTADDWRFDAGVSAKACVGGDVVFAKTEACIHADFDFIHTIGNTESAGSEKRSSASFASGIHLADTPFPEAPAGSLLVVITPTGYPDKLLDVRVVLRDDLIVAPTPPAGFGTQVDISLVANDMGTCSNPSISQLKIEGVKEIPFGNVAKAIGAAMVSTLAQLEAQAPKLLDEGQLTVDEAAALRSQGWTLVQQGVQPLGLGLGNMPYDLRQLFDGFVEAEIASIARRSQMNAITRARKQIELQFEGLQHEAAFSDDQDRLLLLVPRWRLRDLTGVSLGNATDALSEALTTDVAQVFELRDPATFSNFRTQLKGSINLLIDSNLTAPYEGTLKSFQDFASAARNSVNQATFELPTTARRNVVMAIPKTSTTCNGRPCDYGSFRAVSATVAHAFWAANNTAPFLATMTLTPADLYSNEGTGSFSCGDVAPVIRRMALYLDTGDSEIDLAAALSEVRGVAAMSGASVVFPRVGNVLSLEADSPDGVALALPAINGDMLSVPARFGPSPPELGTGAGLSPFTTFRLDLAPFQTGVPMSAMTHANAVFLVFEVERRLSVPNVDVPGVCQAPF